MVATRVPRPRIPASSPYGSEADHLPSGFRKAPESRLLPRKAAKPRFQPCCLGLQISEPAGAQRMGGRERGEQGPCAQSWVLCSELGHSLSLAKKKKLIQPHNSPANETNIEYLILEVRKPPAEGVQSKLPTVCQVQNLSPNPKPCLGHQLPPPGLSQGSRGGERPRPAPRGAPPQLGNPAVPVCTTQI